jgi:dGTPase
LRAGLFTLNDLREVPFLNGLLDEIDTLYPKLETQRRIYELTRRVITRFVEDAMSESESRLARLQPVHADDIRMSAEAVIAFSPPLQEADRTIKAFLFPHMYRHPQVMQALAEADAIIRGLFEHFMAQPEALPAEWQQGLHGKNEAQRARLISDYIAGMTDNYALKAFKKL